MTVARALSDLRYDPNSFVTVGTFDGVHLGHRAIVHELTSRSLRGNGRSVVVTFDPHPRQVLGQGPVQLLSTLDERLEVLDELGIDEALVVTFSYEFSRKAAGEFYEEYLVRGIGVKEVVVGHDHMFGRDREAGLTELRRIGNRFGFTAFALDPVKLQGEVVGSTKIRECLLSGDVERAGKFLGTAYSLTGTVVSGDGRGMALGFPTANICPSADNKIIPSQGVYCVRVGLNGQTYYGMLNIGTRPTFGSNTQRIIEVHIFDFHESINARELRIEFLTRLRSERTFASPEQLIAQLEADREHCRHFLTSLQLS